MSSTAYGDWVGRTMTAEDDLTAGLVEGLRAALDQPGERPAAGEAAPLGVHWLLAPDRAPQRELGPDGHPRRGGFLPPIALPRRLWAASALELLGPLRVGDRIERSSRVAAVSEKTGRSGPLAFVEVDHRIAVRGELRLRERQTIVYRGDAAAAPDDVDGETCDWPWQRDLVPDPVLLFRYSALTFNGHRIHYDRDYVRRVEAYPDLVVHGPLTATLLLDLCARHLDGAVLRSFAFRGRRPAFVDQPLALRGRPDGDAIALAAFGPGDPPGDDGKGRAGLKRVMEAAMASGSGEPQSASSDDQSEVIAFLSRPGSYGSDLSSVERIETHASLVFLAGPHAYKLKRAVRFSYLDYSTVERREAASRAELALNRRTAPELYLEVRPIGRGASGGLAFGGAPPIDWVLVMRRFDQAALFDRMAERDALTPTLMRDLADRIAAFHDAADATRDFGGAAGMAWMIDGNSGNLRLAGADWFSPGDVDRLDRESRSALAALAVLLDRRRDDGRVRHCHGDLHLGNICLHDGRPTLFDGIEFSDMIANVDVLYDLSFLLMDLEHRGLGLLANVLFNRYLDRRDEIDGLAALPLFLSIHAAIRAHVDAAAARRRRDAGGPLHAEAAAYLDLALQLLRPVSPALIAIGGLSGTGKSTVAQALAPGLGAPPGARLLRSDVLRKTLLGHPPEQRLPPESYGPARDVRVYDGLRAAAGRVLAAGHSAILDAVHARPGERAAAAALAAERGVPFAGLWLEAPAPLLAARVDARRDDASDATPDVVRRQLGYDVGAVSWRRIAADAPFDRVVESCRRALAGDGIALA